MTAHTWADDEWPFGGFNSKRFGVPWLCMAMAAARRSRHERKSGHWGDWRYSFRGGGPRVRRGEVRIAILLPSDVRIHDLRHTSASLLISQGVHPRAVQAHLGHSSMSVTMDRYGHLFPSEFEAIAEKLEALHDRAAAQARPKPARVASIARETGR